MSEAFSWHLVAQKDLKEGEMEKYDGGGRQNGERRERREVIVTKRATRLLRKRSVKMTSLRTRALRPLAL